MPTVSSAPRIFSFKDLYGSELLSDVTLRLNDGEEIRAHRAVLAPASSWFKMYFKNDPSYDSQAVVDLSNEDNPAAVKAMVCFCYTNSYDRFLDKSNIKYVYGKSSPYNLGLHVDVNTLAERYRIGTLVEVSAEAIKDYVNNCESKELVLALLGQIRRASLLHNFAGRPTARRMAQCILDTKPDSHVHDLIFRAIAEDQSMAIDTLLNLAKDTK